VITQSPAFHRALKRISVLYRAGFAAIAILAIVAYVFTARAIHQQRQHIESSHLQSGLTIAELGRLETIARVTTAAILLTLLVESILVFRPALRRLQRERDAPSATPSTGRPRGASARSRRRAPRRRAWRKARCGSAAVSIPPPLEWPSCHSRDACST
jgi:hypothetical protein